MPHQEVLNVFVGRTAWLAGFVQPKVARKHQAHALHE